MTKIEKNDIENIKNLEKELKSRDLSSIKIKKGNYEIEISKEIKQTIEKIQKKELPINADQAEDIIQSSEINKENIVTSPMVGVVYLSPDPSAPPYIKERQHVKEGDTLLVIEAMKTFNEIKSPKSGVIQKINVLNILKI